MTGMVTARIEIQCPKCFQASAIDSAKIPQKAVKVRCNRCSERFIIDRNSQLNCKLRIPKPTTPAKTAGKVDENIMSWLVEHKLCKGLSYDVKGLGTLIRSGLINKHTLIRPPGSNGVIKAGALAPLRVYFEEKQVGKVDLDATLEGEPGPTSEDPKAWYKMDCSDFFETKIKSILKKDLLANKKVG